MNICDRHAFCTVDGRITENVFTDANDAKMWTSRLSQDDFGPLYAYEDMCWVPDMVFGLADDDVSAVVHGMTFVSAMNGSGYVEALKGYVNGTDMPESIRADLPDETVSK